MRKKSNLVNPSALLVAALLLPALRTYADDSDTIVGGNLVRSVFGPGTGVIVGVVDSGITTSHPALAGNDSLGNPRLVAETNFVISEPGNTGQDVFGHGTAVMGVIGSSDPTDLGYAPDSRYIDARVLDSSNSLANDGTLLNGFGFAIANGAAIVNSSINLTGQNGASRASMMVDYVEDTLNIPVVVSAGNNGLVPNHPAMSPADSYNAFSVGATSRASGFTQTTTFSAFGPDADGLVRPIISAPGDQIVTTAVSGTGFQTWSGTSFSAPAVTGMLSDQIEYGRANNLSTNTMVLRSTLLNSAQKINERDGSPWTPSSSFTSGGVVTNLEALDNNSGSGQIDGSQLITQYTAGQHSPGAVPATGWDLNSFATSTGATDYAITAPLTAGQTLTATLTWDRHINWIDTDNNGIIDSADTFTQTQRLSNLDLALFLNGTLVADSISTIDNIEQINFPITTTGTYDLEVSRLLVSGAAPSESYSLAWMTTPATTAPEPASLLLFAFSATLLLRTKRKTRHHR